MKVALKPKKLFEVISKSEVEEINGQSLQVLKKVGMKIDDEEVIELLGKAGASVDRSKLLAKIPSSMVNSALKLAPKKFKLHARNPENDLLLNDKFSYSRTTSGALHVYDWRLKKHRDANLDDLKKFVRLTDVLDAINTNEAVVDPQEIPHKVRDIYTSRVVIESEKHVIYPPASRLGARALIEMASVVVGGEEELRKRPILTGTAALSPPLHYDSRGIGIFREFVSRGLPVELGSEEISGGISPVTLAGTVTQANAEALAGLVIAQVINPGTPVIYGAFCNVLDMKTGVAAMGTPETALMGAAMTQLARYYNLPSWAYHDVTESKLPDMQAGYEKMMNILLPLMAGVDIYAAAGNLATAMCTSYETLVIDNEIVEMCMRILEGINVNLDTMALDEISSVGPGGSFLGLDHTFRHFRQEHWVPSVSERNSLNRWIEGGSKDVVQRAEERAEALLKEYEPRPLEEGISEELDVILKKYEILLDRSGC